VKAIQTTIIRKFLPITAYSFFDWRHMNGHTPCSHVAAPWTVTEQTKWCHCYILLSSVHTLT